MIPLRLSEDADAFRQQGQQIEIVEDGSRFYVILKRFRLPDGKYSPSETDLMVMADYQYPLSRLDMYWTDPPVRLASGALPSRADQFEAYGGRRWQRWSWHYPAWDPSKHNLRTHVEVFHDRLCRDV